MSESYFYQALKQVAGKSPPNFMVGVDVNYYPNIMSDEDSGKLADWAASEGNLPWATGQGVINAAISIVKDAVENGNITESETPSDDLCLQGGVHSFFRFGDQKSRRCNQCSCLEG